MEANNNLPTLAASNLTAEQQEIINAMQAYAKQLEHRAMVACGEWVVAGYAGSNREPIDYYCYCGIGKGYQGAPLTPANANAVQFATKQAAERKAQLLKYTNGHGERIWLEAVPASDYFWLLWNNTVKTLHDTLELINIK